ncbi:putative FAD linked oxidase domain-containing protein [Magnetofaba australis IT-1]|uniref:Putative FAD linked oxidase domain-containing protein n=1 Tax=Magnetofaba australis IT-1 TaxID=1434232 RepID=A0A1Y2JYU4_9PROT|nr:putative FAD linked oxidase domain-containing protein [Magnetofaba australis IT-1]
MLTDAAALEAYAWDNTGVRMRPQAAALAVDAAGVAAALACCAQHNVPVTPRGAGTGNVGGALALHGGVILSTQRMTRIVDVDPADRVAVVEPGVINATLQQAAGEHGLFWPPAPSSARACSIGGNLAMGAAGPNSLRYGGARNWTLSLEAALADGSLIHTGSRAAKDVAGFDLTSLLVGSEGTLGIITRATLKLAPKPTHERLMRAAFASVDAAAQAVSAIMASGEAPGALEIMDAACLDLLREAGMAIPEGARALLLAQAAGDAQSCALQADALRDQLLAHNPLELFVAADEQEAKRAWEARYKLSPALKKLSPKRVNEDIVVPVSQLPALFDGVAQIAARWELPCANFGHAGDGNIHVNFLVDPADPAQTEKIAPALDQLFALVTRLEGSLTGEHGVGAMKRDYLTWQTGVPAWDWQRRIKQLFDPNGILNPGKIFSEDPRPRPHSVV